MKSPSQQVWARMRCVNCGNPLREVDSAAVCANCGTTYPLTGHGSLDLRLQRTRHYAAQFKLEPSPLTEHDFTSEPLKATASPAVDFSGLAVPRHLTPEILTYFPKARSNASLMLDLGCGEAVHEEVCRRAGYEWVGMDYQANKAPILGDAQCIPFQDGTFEFVLCVTVLQYVRNPFVAMREMCRVLKPGGTLIGTVAFLEPSHGTSFYHPSHVGIYSLLLDAGFTPRKVAPFADWPALKALASMGLFSGMPRQLAQAVVAPLQFFHVLWWRLGGLLTGRNLEADRLNHFSGSFSFVATRPE